MPMKPYLLLALVAFTLPASLVPTPALAQGTFSYSFTGDTSPWNIGATFTASSRAVGTGWLSWTNINFNSLLITVNGERWTWGQWPTDFDARTLFNMRVDPISGQPSVGDYIFPGTMWCYADESTTTPYDMLELGWGGSASWVTYWHAITYTRQDYAFDPGHWSVSYTSVPEPSSAALLALGALGSWVLLRRARVNQSRQPMPGVRLSAYLAPLARRGCAHR
jgi:hypothetical protein